MNIAEMDGTPFFVMEDSEEVIRKREVAKLVNYALWWIERPKDVTNTKIHLHRSRMITESAMAIGFALIEHAIADGVMHCAELDNDA